MKENHFSQVNSVLEDCLEMLSKIVYKNVNNSFKVIIISSCAETFPDITFYKFEGIKKDTVAIIKSLVRRKKKRNEIMEEKRN
eukprot:Pgem_evm1s2757